MMPIAYFCVFMALVGATWWLESVTDSAKKRRSSSLALGGGALSGIAAIVWICLPLWGEMADGAPGKHGAVAAFNAAGQVTSDSNWFVVCWSKCANFARETDLEVWFTRPDARVIVVRGTAQVTDAARFFASDGLLSMDRIVKWDENRGRLIQAVYRPLYDFAAENMSEFSCLTNPLDPGQFQALEESVTFFVNGRLRDRGTSFTVTSFDLQ
ncbi:MAG: hypothetical protein Q7R83_00170 [bacterium]|nr:hypothetical protein [bacterium]